MLRSKKRKLVVLSWVQRCLIILNLPVLLYQFAYGFSVNLTGIIFLLVVCSYVSYRKRIEIEYLAKLESVNYKWSQLRRPARREYLYRKGIKNHVKRA